MIFPRGRPSFRHNRVTSQINFRESAKGTTILGGPGACPRENFGKLNLKMRIFVHSGSKFQTKTSTTQLEPSPHSEKMPSLLTHSMDRKHFDEVRKADHIYREALFLFR